MYYNFFVSIKYSKSQQNDHKFVFIVLLLDHFSLTFQPRFEPALIQNFLLLLQTFCLYFVILGIRKELYVWCIETEELVKTLDAHFARIVEIHQLTMPGWNAVITASIDRTVKVWNINYIFEPEHHIDRH